MAVKMLVASGLVLLSLMLLTVPTSAECPNGCSGNGACMAKDMCQCYKNYQGNDCMDRTCQFGYAHADTPKGDINFDQSRLSVYDPTTGLSTGWLLLNSQQDPAGTYEFYNPAASSNEAHFYMECSNKGLCDRSLGVCTCFDGYEGSSCQRAACPNKCNGHGTCESIREFGLKTPGTLVGYPSSSTQQTYDLWDARVTYGCRCDPWYRGADCSLRSCKVGIDPMFLSVGFATYEVFVLHAWIATTATWVANAASGPPANFVRLRLFDYHGESFITDMIPIISDKSSTASISLANAQTNAASVAAAIKKIPNQTFGNVLCEPMGGVNVGSYLFGYMSSRTASTEGLSVVCQFISNPGRMRTPEIPAYGFNGVVDPTLKFAKILSMEKGKDSEWFTTDSKLVITAKSVNGLTLTTSGATAGTVTLFKLESHVVAGLIASATSITLTYPLLHTIGTSVTRFVADPLSSFAVTEIVTTAVAVGDTSITFTAVHGITTTGTVFFENQFYTATMSTTLIVNIDRPFPGNTVDGTANTILKAYVVTPPGSTYEYSYVSPCSGRGLCTAETGVCACFKGYTDDNCDTQNILAL